MTCRHAFHKSCVDKWLQTGRNNCPACRTPVCFCLVFFPFSAFLITVIGCFDGRVIANTLAHGLKRLIASLLHSYSFTLHLHIPIHHDLESAIAPYHCFAFPSLVVIAIVVSNSPHASYSKSSNMFSQKSRHPFPLLFFFSAIASLSPCLYIVALAI
jgi:hypothetical protein